MFLTAGIDLSGLVPGLKSADTLEGAVGLIPSRPEEDVLILCGPREAMRAPWVARAALEHDRVAIVTIPGTPTRQAAIASLVLSIPTSHLGVAQAVVGASQRIVVTRVALTSVSRLEAGRPSMLQHLRSFFPGASFDVDVVTREVTSVKPVDWSQLPAAMSVEARSEHPGGDRAIAVVAPPAGFHLRLDPATWNARSWVERSALPDAPNRMAIALAQRAGCSGCPTCGRPAGPTDCLFCGNDRTSSGTMRSNRPMNRATTEGARI